MTARASSEAMAQPLAGSVLLHGAILGGLFAYGLIGSPARDAWGEKNAIPGAGVAITTVNKIPMVVRHSKPNPVADDSESEVTQKAEERKLEKKPREDPDAIELNTHTQPKRYADVVRERSRYTDPNSKPNQLTSNAGRAVSNPLYGTPGAGGVGIGTGTPFGNRFGAYADAMRRRIAEKWNTNDLDSHLRTAPPAIVTFELLRDGSVRNIRITQSSGNLALDYTTRRAVMEAAPFAPLPREFERDVANIEFWFQLQR